MRRALLLPEGTDLIGPDETILWQGRPSIAGLAARQLHVRGLMGYFAVLAAWDLATSYRDGVHPAVALMHTSWVALAALAVAGVIFGAAALMAITSRYMITNHRVILQIGVTLPIALTLPLKHIASADLRLHPDGSGDIPLQLDDGKLAYLLIWPHARPWHVKIPQPMLLGVPSAGQVAAVLSRARHAISPDGIVSSQTILGTPRAIPQGDGLSPVGAPAA